MAIQSFKKAPVKYIDPIQKEYITVKPVKKNPLTLGHILGGVASDFKNLLITSKVAGFLIPFIIILFGVSIIYHQVWPDIEQRVKQISGYYDNSTIPLVAGDYIEKAQYLSNPGSDYFKKLNDDASSTNILKDDPTSRNYRGRFTISIPSLDFNNLPVTANVDSGNETVYRNILNTTLAHFQGTGLPISDVSNNIVIYGHSSAGDYFERTHDLAGAFSRLNRIQVGDQITIKMEGKEYVYRVVKSKIVQPDDASIITGTRDKRTLTLFTCFPNGNSAQRFVAIANPV
jgi:sortase A